MKQTLLIFVICFQFFGHLIAQNIPAYYNSIDFTLYGMALKQALAEHITNTHENEIAYYNDILTTLRAADQDPENTNNVLLIYGWANTTSGTNARTRNKYNFDNNNFPWNREHVYARSKGTPNLGFEGAGADAHNLRPCDATKNSDRSNLKFANGSGNSNYSGSGWYPGDEWKGDVARMVMYMYLRYGTQCIPTNIGIGNSNNTPDAMIDLFLQWNVEDPVSEVEIQRNNVIASNDWYGQGNRNPFIDNPFLASKIWGGPLAEDTWGLLNTTEHHPLEFALYPNPTHTNSTHISCQENIREIHIYTIDGKHIQAIFNPIFINNTYKIENLTEGFYLIQLNSENKKSTKKLIVR